jgi:hypothetical protein
MQIYQIKIVNIYHQHLNHSQQQQQQQQQQQHNYDVQIVNVVHLILHQFYRKHNNDLDQNQQIIKL